VHTRNKKICAGGGQKHGATYNRARIDTIRRIGTMTPIDTKTPMDIKTPGWLQYGIKILNGGPRASTNIRFSRTGKWSYENKVTMLVG